MWDLIVSVPDHCLSFYFRTKGNTLESEISAGPLTGSCISPICLIGAVSRYSE